MKNQIRFATHAATAALLAATSSSHAALLVDLNPATALYDSDVKGVVADGGSGPADTAGHVSGIPLIDDVGADGAGLHSKGFTFNIAFTPLAADLTGTKLLIEVGATSNGSGIYLVNGVPTFIGKQGANDAALPTSLNDTLLNTIAVQSSIGKLEAGVAYSVSASWNHTGTLEVAAAPEGGSKILNSFAISGNPGNWSGNDTLSVKTFSAANAGGLSGNNAANVFGPPFDVNNAGSFTGAVSRAIFWNAHSVTPLTLTPPVVKGFSVTTLPTTGKVRLHWNVTEGGLPNATTIAIKDTANLSTVVYTPTALTGFVDLTTATTSFTLTATNNTGATSSVSGIEQDTPFSAVVRQSNPLAWYRFNEGAGAKLLVDSAENASPLDGDVLGASAAGGTGFIDHAGVFEGASVASSGNILNPGAYQPVAVDPVTPRKGFSIETIIRRRTGTPGNHVLVSQTDVDGTGRVILAVGEDGTIYNQIPGGGVGRKEADEKLPADSWSHLVQVIDPGTTAPGTAEVRWYLDGKKIGSSKDGVNPDGSSFEANFLLEASLGKWVFGAAKTLASDFWKGDIDEIAVYGSLLDDPNGDGLTDDSRIAAHRNAWYSEANGIIQFSPVSPVVSTGGSTALVVRVGPDVTSATINNGVGDVNLAGATTTGTVTIPVAPTATTTYVLTTTGGAGPFTASTTITYQQLTAPVIQGFEATNLPTAGKVRLHWKATSGAFPTPVNITLKSGSTVLFQSTALSGFVDVPAGDATGALTIEAENSINKTIATAEAPAADTPFSAAVRAAAPVAWFRFNEFTGSGLLVDSAENTTPHNGTLTGPSVAVNESGFIDRAGKFNTASAFVTDRIVDLSVLESGFTIETIVRNDPGNNATNRIIVAQQDSGGTGRQLLTVDGLGTIRANFGGGVRKDADILVPHRTWTHIVSVFDVVNVEIRWYVDGVYAGTSGDGKNPDGTEFDPTLLFEFTNGAWVIGATKTVDGGFWKGHIDDLVVYDKQLDDPNGDGTRDDSLVASHRTAWWNETSGLIYAKTSADTINAGDPLSLTLKVGADVTAVNISPSGPAVTLVDGNAVIPLNPSGTTTYTVTLTTPTGPVTTTFTVTVNGGAVELKILSSTIESGNFVLNFQGAPSTAYKIVGSSNGLTSFTEDHSTVTTDGSGIGHFSIAVDPLKPQRFFRVQLPQ